MGKTRGVGEMYVLCLWCLCAFTYICLFVCVCARLLVRISVHSSLFTDFTFI